MEEYLIDNSERLSKLENDIKQNNRLPYIELKSFKDLFLSDLSTDFNKTTDVAYRENKLIDTINKIVFAKKFVNSNVEGFYLKKTLLNSYNSLYDEIQSTYEVFHPDIFVIKEIRALNNIPTTFSGYDSLLGAQFETKKDSVDYFPDIFKTIDTYNSFKEYSDKHIIEPYIDYSYLFQRMLHEKLIHKKTQFEYINWLRDNKFIKDAIYDKFYVERGLRSLNKSTTANRENNFNNIFNL